MTVSAFGMAPPATQQQQQQPLPYSTNVVRQHDPMVLSSPQKTSYIGGPSEHAQPKASMKTRSHNNQQQQQQQGMQQHQVNQTYAQPVYTNSNFYYSAMNYGAPGAAARSNYQKLQETAEAAATAAPLKGARRGPRQYYTKNDNLPAIPGGSHVVQQQNAATPSSSGSGTSFLSVGGIAAKIVSGIGSLGKGSNGGSSGNRAWKK